MRRWLLRAAVLVVPLLAASPAAAAPPTDPNTRAVCTTSAKTVQDGLSRFIVELQKVTENASTGDLDGAERAVQVAGGVLVGIGTKLRLDASQAQATDLRGALVDLATEFEARGKGLNSLGALSGFDTRRLEALADRIAVLCGAPPLGTPLPGPTPS
jgi:hypothetical protein